MPSIKLNLHFVATGQDVTLSKRFDLDTSLGSLEATVKMVITGWLAQHDPKKLTGWCYTGYTLDSYDTDFASPSDFNNLDDYAEYIGKCEVHGEGYTLCHADVGDFDFDALSEGCYETEEQFVQEAFERHGSIPDHAIPFIDWDEVEKTIMQDYVAYEGNEGVHVFQRME